MKTCVVLFVLVASALSQRAPFAGKDPIGYPIIESSTSALGNRFGDDDGNVQLPIEALGDVALVNRLSKLPVDQQPFWLINWKATQANRENPKTYQQRPNSFIDNFRNVKA